MTESTLVVVALLLLGWAVVSAALGRLNVTGPIVFTVAGYVVGNPDWGPLPVDVEAASVHTVAEVTLALVLFSDASRVNVGELRRDVGLPSRLLAFGLPLSVVLGSVVAAVTFGDLPWALAVFVGAALAPTDAALSAQVISDERIPMRLRRALNVESGLNDGIATPIVTSMLLIAATQIGLEAESEPTQVGDALRELAGGLGLGIAFGVVGAALMLWASARDWMVLGGRRLAALAIAVGAFVLARDLDFNGFIAAFAAGIAFGAMFDRQNDVEDVEEVGELPELGGQALALVVWFLFGATLVPVAFDQLNVRLVIYSLLSLSLVRMLPVWLGMTGSGLDRPSSLFLGWFGPRGLASVVFALLAIEQLGESSAAVGQAVAAVALTVLGSVVLHGITAGPGGRRYVHVEEDASEADRGPVSRSHRFLHRHRQPS